MTPARATALGLITAVLDGGDDALSTAIHGTTSPDIIPGGDALDRVSLVLGATASIAAQVIQAWQEESGLPFGVLLTEVRTRIEAREAAGG